VLAESMITTGSVIKPRSERSSYFGITLMFYGTAGQNVFTPSTLQQMCEVENLVLGFKNYPDVCVLSSTPNATGCIQQSTLVTSMFYDSSSWYHNGIKTNNRNCSLLSDSHVQSVTSTIIAGAQDMNTRQAFSFFCPADVLTTSLISYTRSSISFGTPLQGFSSSSDRESEQKKIYQDMLGDLEADLFDHFGMTGTAFRSPYATIISTKDLEVKFIGSVFRGMEMARMVQGDLQFLFASILFVLFYLWAHLGSFFLACMGMISIICSIYSGLFVYWYIFGIHFYSNMMVLTFFLALGVGADDLFVFVDGWKQTCQGVPRTEHAKLYWTYFHTAHAVFNTSFTTVMAFVGTGISPIITVSTFGYYAATCIVMNYVFCLIYTPGLVIIWSRYIEHRPCCSPLGDTCCCCCCCSSIDSMERIKAIEAEGKALPSAEPLNGESPSPYPDTNEVSQASTDDKEDGQASANPTTPVQVAMVDLEASGGVEPSVQGPGVQAPAIRKLPSQGTMAAPEGDQTQEVEAMDAEAKMIQGMPCFQRFFATYYVPCVTNKYVAASFVVVLGAWTVLALWSALKLEPPKEPEEWYQESHMWYNIANIMANDYLASTDNQYVKVALVWGMASPYVNRDGFEWNTPCYDRGAPIWDPAFDLSTAEGQQDILDACAIARNFTCTEPGCQGGYGMLAIPGSVKCWMEQFQAWYQTTYGVVYTPGLKTGEAFMDELKLAKAAWQGSRTLAPYAKELGFVQGKLAFTRVTMHLTLLNNQPYGTKYAVFQRTEEMAAEVQKKMSPGMEGMFQTAGHTWSWMATEAALVRGMFLGFAVCFPTALGVLIIATQNVVLSLYATISIASIVASVLGCCQLGVLGKDLAQLGIAESIVAIIVVGFSVDYVVHLGHIYAVSEKETRLEKVKDAGYGMAHTVTAGAVTTLGAGIVMLACKMTFFVKMAKLMVMVIFFSLTYSLGFFMPLCVLVGPQDGVGDLRWIKVWLAQKCWPSESTSVQSGTSTKSLPEDKDTPKGEDTI